jgi:hypothetical protein
MRTKDLYLVVGADKPLDETTLYSQVGEYWSDDRCEIEGVNFGQIYGDYVMVDMAVSRLMDMGYQNIYCLKYTSESQVFMDLGPRFIPYQG